MKDQVAYNTIGSAVTLFFQWAIMMIIPKIGGFSDAGVFAVALSICSILNIIATLYHNQYQVADQYQRFSENDYFVCRVFTIALSFVLCFVTIIAFGYSSEQGLVIVGYMLYRNFLHFAYLHMATLQIENHLDYAGKCMIIEGIISFISFIVTYYFTNDLVLSTVLMAILGGGSFLILLAYGYRRFFGKNYPMDLRDTHNLRPLILVGIPLMMSAIAPIIITALPKLILQMYWGDEITGIFSTLTAPTIIVPTLVQGVFVPFIIIFSNYAKNGDMRSIQKNYLKMIALILAFGALVWVISILFAGFLFELLYGDYIVPYVKYFHDLIIGIVLYSIGICGVTVLITKDQGREAAISTIIALIISFVIFIAVVPDNGIEAATYGLVASYGVFCAIVSFFVLFCRLDKRGTEC